MTNSWWSLTKAVARELGASLDDVTVSFDGGGNSAAALSSLPFHFVCAHSLAGLKELLDIPLSEYSEVDLGDGHKRLARRVDGLEFSGVEGTGVLTVSEDLRRGQEAELARREARLAKRAEELRERLKNPRSRLFAKLRKAAGEAEQRALAVKGYNSDLERDRAAGKGGGRRRRPKPKAFDVKWSRSQGQNHDSCVFGETASATVATPAGARGDARPSLRYGRSAAAWSAGR